MPEGFFIQVFNATQLNLFIFAYEIIGAVLNCIDSNLYDIVSFIVLFLIMGRTYRQLFGYGRWATLWRILMVLVASAALLCIFINVAFCISIAFDHNWVRLQRNLFIRLPLYLGVFIITMSISTWIGKRSHNKGIHNADNAAGEDNEDNSNSEDSETYYQTPN